MNSVEFGPTFKDSLSSLEEPYNDLPSKLIHQRVNSSDEGVNIKKFGTTNERASTSIMNKRSQLPQNKK